MELKYTLTEESKIVKTCYSDTTVYRIVALKDFGQIRKGELGGWVGSYDNLSHEGESWVSSGATVCHGAIVRGDAQVHGQSLIYDDAIVQDKAMVTGNATVFGRAFIEGNAMIYDRAAVGGTARISDDAAIGGHATITMRANISDNARIAYAAVVTKNAHVFGNACIYNGTILGKVGGTVNFDHNVKIPEDAWIESSEDYLIVSPIGSDRATLFVYIDDTDDVMVSRGCFCDTVEEFIKRVHYVHGDNQYGVEYGLVIELIKNRFPSFFEKMARSKERRNEA